MAAAGQSATGGRQSARPVWMMLFVFVTVYCAFNLAYFLIPDHWLKEVFHHYGLLLPCAQALNWMYGSGTVSVSDGALVSQGAYLAIVRGCDGAGLVFLLGAAIACYPSTLRAKLTGFIAGIALVYLLNLVRIFGLFLVFRDHRHIFADLHNLVIPLLLLLACGGFFLWWSAGDRQAREVSISHEP